MVRTRRTRPPVEKRALRQQDGQIDVDIELWACGSVVVSREQQEGSRAVCALSEVAANAGDQHHVSQGSSFAYGGRKSVY